MGGITAIYAIKPDQSMLKRMTDPLSHRGHAETAVFSCGDRAFLHTHLSNGEGPNPPVVNASGNLCIAFSGRLYNRRHLLKQISPDPAFAGQSDAELVLRLYEEQGRECAALLDGSFAFVIADAEKGLFIARDPLGLKPLYFSEKDGDIYLASEMKGLAEVVSEFQEFPEGSIYQTGIGFQRVFALSEGNTEWITMMPEAIAAIHERVAEAVAKRIVPDARMGVFLSGGLDSSIIAAVTARALPGVDTFAVGVAGSEDLRHARLCADLLGTNHHEYIYDLEEMLSLLPTVIRHLESFDAALVRSSVPNYILARLAAKTAQVVFTGEGADELFCGYQYMKEMPEAEMKQEIFDVLGTLHNTNLQRGDRMAMAHSVEAHVPFLDLDFIKLAFQIPIGLKIGPENQEKWALRQAYAEWIPEEIVYRKKQKFSHGAGSYLAMAEVAEKTISDEAFACESVTQGGHRIQNKEELMYYRIFREQFPQLSVEKAIGFSKSL